MDKRIELHRIPGFSLAQILLFFLTVVPASLLALYGLAVSITLGRVVPPSYVPLLLAGYLLLMFLLFRTGPHGIRRMPRIRGYTKGPDPQTAAWKDPHISSLVSDTVTPKHSVCEFCGMEFGGEKCDICGRVMCDGCRPTRSRIHVCPECNQCPTCREGSAWIPCTGCGKWVCSDCFRKGLCIECLSQREHHETAREQLASRLVVEPSVDMSNALCKEISQHAKEELQSSSLQLGQSIGILGISFKVVGTMPPTSGSLAVGRTTVVNLVNRKERDTRLRNIRKRTGWPICYATGCDYSIGRRCNTCHRRVCPNHSGFCKECKKILCHECEKEGLCQFCYDTIILKKERPKLSIRETVTTLGRMLYLLPITMIFLYLFYYGDKIPIDPTTRMILAMGIMALGPIIASAYLVGRALRRRTEEG